MCATCAHVRDEQNGKSSVLGRGACFISLERCEGCKVGAGRGYTHLTENVASPPVLLQHCLHQMSKYYFTLGGKIIPNKQISLASRHTARTKITSLQVTASFCHPTLFVCLPGRSMGKRWQKHNIRFLLRWRQQGTALGQRLLEERARLPPGPISNVVALSARGLLAVMNMTASGLCAAPFIPFERK